MAIPLGQPRVDAGPPQLSRLFISRHPVTLATSIPLAQPKPARKPNVAVVTEVQSERKQPPQLQVQVLPSVDIDSVPSAVPSPRPPPLDIQTAEQAQEEEQNIFPGTGYLSIADISEEPEEEPVDTPIELNGSARPPTTLYHGPAYPPQPAGPLPDTEPILGTIQQRETLENRLVDRVEQQLMARMITEMYPQRVQIEQASLSEPEESCVSSSDIVEAAGGGGLQMFVDAGVPVDSALIRRYVTDALAETIVLMLGQREGQTGPVSPAPPRDVPAAAEVVVVPTPVPTPLPSPRESPVPPSRVSPPPSTPEPSEQGSATESPRDVLPSREPQDTGPTEPERSAVATPAITPVASPPRVATPPTAPPTSQSTESAQHSKPWGDAELPLEEEVQHCKTKEPEQHNSPVDDVCGQGRGGACEPGFPSSARFSETFIPTPTLTNPSPFA
ncbi:hypothetical protein AAFF_G00412260 [Aldrovandia affinis]|uniref:Uncharacterized protein n=1 Tax=Aldrovandia affinis TaxID=143900 RepID=A0AAD7SBJ3_9TELE|nr:hypothetical protein AAFF_G00412260 [Aldrovandia affinis]